MFGRIGQDTDKTQAYYQLSRADPYADPYAEVRIATAVLDAGI